MRATQFVEAVEEALRDSPRPPARTHRGEGERTPAGLRYEDCALRCHLEAPAACQLRCPYCCTAEGRRGRPGLAAPRSHFQEGFARLRQQVGGPLWVTILYGEPTADRDCMVLARWLAGAGNLVELSSNLVAPLSEWEGIPRNGNVRIATSFHPHAWPGGIEAFLDKRDAMAEAGLPCGWITVVGWPPFLHHLAEWRATVEARGEHLNVEPFGGVWEGATYPAAYTDEEWALMGREASQAGYSTAPTGELCRTGAEYLYIRHDGTAARCYMPRARVLGNLLRYDVKLLDGPTPCAETACPCSGLWDYRGEAIGPGCRATATEQDGQDGTG